MPMPYSHYVLAQKIADEGKLAVEEKAAYYLGAFMPDIRYFTQLPREKYHFPVKRLEPYYNNVNRDFLLGYKVHLIIDEVWEYPEMKQAYYGAFPPLLRRRMTRGLQALAFEMFCLKEPVEVVELKPIENRLTQDLEVKPADITRAVTSMQRYLKQHDLAAALEMAKEANLFPEARLKTVEGVVNRMRNPIMRAVVNAVVANASRPMLPRVVQAVVERLERHDATHVEPIPSKRAGVKTR